MYEIWKSFAMASAGVYLYLSIGILVFWIRGKLNNFKSYFIMASLSFSYCFLSILMFEPPFLSWKLTLGFPLILFSGTGATLAYLYSIQKYLNLNHGKIFPILIQWWKFLTISSVLYFLIPFFTDDLNSIYIKAPLTEGISTQLESYSGHWAPNKIGLAFLGTIGVSTPIIALYLLNIIIKNHRKEVLLIAGLICTIIVNTNDVILGTRLIRGLMPLAFAGLLFESIRFFLVAHERYQGRINSLMSKVDDLKVRSELVHVTSMLSHDLRNIFRRLKVKDYSPEVREELNGVLNASNHLLDVYSSRFQQSGGKQQSSVSLNEVLQMVEMALEKDLKEIKIKVTSPKKPTILPIGVGDAVVIFLNLMGNSIDILRDSSNQKKEIEVVVEESVNKLDLFFNDTGPGISKPIQEKLFDPFHSSKNQGIGLGLNIVQEILMKNNGTINYIPKNSGACFRLTFFS